MDFYELMEGMQKVFEVLFDVSKWLNGNVFSKTGGLVDIIKKVIDFISGLFSGDGFSLGSFDLGSLGLGGIGDFFGGLFG